MATATNQHPAPAAVEGPAMAHDYTCTCGHVLRVSGLGRHRIYFPVDSRRLDDPIMDGLCPNCGKGLPGK